MAVEKLILVANPGSASRKYAVYRADECLAKIHFEHIDKHIVYSFVSDGQKLQQKSSLAHLSFAGSQVLSILQLHGSLDGEAQIDMIALRVVAPSTYFQKDVAINDTAIRKLNSLEERAPLHVNATLQEAHLLRKHFPDIPLTGISDNAFHASMPEHARYYGLPLDSAEKFDIKRFGYHGLSIESVVQSLKQDDKLPLRTIVCHLGSGSSITAVKNGHSIGTTMGYSPLEGLIMSTRSGSLDVTAALALKHELGLSDRGLEEYLNNQSGLLGVSDLSPDIRQLLKEQANGNHRAGLALNMYAHRVIQAIGQMAAELGGADALIFTGTVGERSRELRRRIVGHLMYLGLSIDAGLNHSAIEPPGPIRISPASQPGKIYVVPSDEERVMAAHATKFS